MAVIGAARGVAQRAREAGITIFGFAVDEGSADLLDRAGISRLGCWAEAREALSSPRTWLLDLVPGASIDQLLEEASAHMEPGDLILDLSGSWWCDSLRRWRRLRHRALWFLDIAEVPRGEGHLWLAGGERAGFALARPLLERLAAPWPVHHVGSAGAAHFLLALQEAVHAARLQAHSEAVQLAEAWPGELDCALARTLWPPLAEGCGREGWVLDDAVRLEAAIPLLAQAAMLRLAERLEEHRSKPPPPRCGTFVTELG